MATTPTQFGEYTLGRHLARGGMADIYLAENAVGRPVVVKKIREELSKDPSFTQLFLREARIAMGLHHGNIAQVFDFGEVDGQYFLAMEHVDGVSLHRLMVGGARLGMRLPLPVATHVLAEVATGLQHAHSLTDERGDRMGIVHRDVTPQNIMISFQGEVKLVDFGVAKARTAASLTRPGVARGKFLYFSPEQVREQSLDGRSDVYTCGVVLYHLMLGQLPFDGELVDVLRAIHDGKFIDPDELDPSLPAPLVDICLRAMATDPARRYPQAQELAADLHHWLHAELPTFTAEPLGEFVRYACTADLEELDRSGEAARRLPEVLSDWVRYDPGIEPPADEMSTEARALPDRRRRRLLAAALAGGVAVALATIAVLLAVVQPPPPAQVTQVESQPTGARVFIDERDTGLTTPAELPEVKLGVPVVVTLRLEGHETQRVTVAGGDRVSVQLIADAIDPESPDAAQLAADRAAASAANSGPLPSTRIADGHQRHFFRLSEATLDLVRAAEPRVKIDPTRTQQVNVAGNIYLATKAMPSTRVLYYAYLDDAPDRIGLLGRREGDVRTLPRGTSEAVFFVVNPAGFERRGLTHSHGEMRIYVAGREGDPLQITSETVLNPWRRRAPFLRLDFSHDHEIRVRIDGDLGSDPERVVIWAAMTNDVWIWSLKEKRGQTGDQYWGLVEDGGSFQLEAVGALWLFLLDADPRDNEGVLEVDVIDRGPSPLAGMRMPGSALGQ